MSSKQTSKTAQFVTFSLNYLQSVPITIHLIRRMRKEEMQGQICCIIYDTVMYFADAVANHLNIPSIVMRPNNAAYVLGQHTMFRLRAERCSLTESQLQETMPELQPFRYKDLPISPTTEIPEAVAEFLETTNGTGSSRAIIWNTMDELEHSSLSQLQRHCRAIPFFTIGPFHKMAPASETSLLEEDSSCIQWLNKQAPNSVLYVSLGSLTTIEQKELTETAWGLVKSEQSFLWVIRPSSVSGSVGIEQLPEDLEKMIGERGCIVKWAPQKKILAHSAVGGFFSHCGWNSTLESISEGVPMICRPQFADQMINARYLTHVWNVGMDMEHTLDREVIEKTVKRLMVGIEGEGMRKRAIEMKHKFEVSVQKGGHSYKSLDEFTEFISSLSLNK